MAMPKHKIARGKIIRKHTKKFKHRRDVFDHAIYFVGWYAAQARRVLKT